MTSFARWRVAALFFLAILLGFAAMWFGFWAGGTRGVRRAPAVLPLTVCVVRGAGDAGASWVRTPDGRFIVIGAGASPRAARLVASLRAAGARRIDLLILPSFQPEQIGGAAALLDAFPVANVAEAGVPAFDKSAANDAQYQVRLRLVQKQIPVVTARTGEAILVGGSGNGEKSARVARIEFLAPTPPKSREAPRGPRDDILMTRLVYRNATFLWSGGLSRAAERELLDRAAPGITNRWLLLTIGYGIHTPTPELLRLVSPELCVVASTDTSADGTVEDFSGTLETRLRATGARIFVVGASSASASSGGGKVAASGSTSDLMFRSDGETISAAP